MPIEVGLWNITTNTVNKIEYSSIDSEKRLEDIICNNISILDDDLLIIGRQTPTIYGKYIDLLGINSEGKLTIIELKKNKTPREVIAQVLDYASWIKDLSYTEVKNICKNYHNEEFESLFAEKFGESPPEKINQEHNMVIVCSELDNETERILNYLSGNYNVPINAVFFRFFSDNKSDYLSRSWLIDPIEAEERTSKSGAQSKGEPWNGRDFVVNIDECDGVSTWEDTKKYGFVSAGGGIWYSKTMKNLFPGARIFAMIPKKGYLGVAKVLEESVPIKDFLVRKGNKEVPILEVPLKCENIKNNWDNPDSCEYLVRVEWLKILPDDQPYWVKGLSANQNSAFKLRNKFTLDKLTEHFQLDD
ncbi:hypothetical protein J2128_000136 [Methanomicrobium sp. W14]|uniref:endonuclease NucS domain-containing protein n=1 Tax=Methanomicrobium sp. W14 TaxID=2817839 RepID=UPI001AE5B34E|nr:endonuclease NucS domain-containing protein [Methanomicrobium sp. W14]MBP2132215.1 hypothetical protein [Methanomicrobium sp. W14]